MFLTLFLKECRQMLKCLTYYAILICILLFYTTQMGNVEMISKPQPGQKSYGYTYSEDKSVIMNETANLLKQEYIMNQYGTYPIGFYKKVVLSKENQTKIEDILTEITGEDAEKLAASSKKVSVVKTMTYGHFTKLMTKVDQLLGGGSSYAEKLLKNNAYVPRTYKQALREYNSTVENDHYTGAYARYFCDYMGIVLAILPVFLAVTRGLRDKRAKANEIIYARNASSRNIVLSRYFAMVAMLILPIILLSFLMGTQCIYYASKAGISVDYTAFIQYTLGWLLPTVMVTLALGLFFTELTDTPIAIIIQVLWWIISLFGGMVNMVGNYGFNLIPRHNTIGEYQKFQDGFITLLANRITYTILALILAIGTVIVYDLKRKGRLNIHGKIFANRKSKH